MTDDPTLRLKRDFRLLVALDVLLQEESVTGAAGRLQLSAPAMSRTLTRIRQALGDPVLVRSGRGMVPTPKALALRERVHLLVREAETLLSPGSGDVDIATVRREFAVIVDDEYLGAVAPALTAAARRDAPGMVLRFLTESSQGDVEFHDGAPDLEIGSIDRISPQHRVAHLFQDRYVGAVRAGHVFGDGQVSRHQFAGAGHVGVARRGTVRDPIDRALAEHGLRRNLALLVSNHISALVMVLQTELVATVPLTSVQNTGRTLDLRSFELPMTTDPVDVGMAWHVRLDADPVHRWLRKRVREILADRDAASHVTPLAL